MQQEGSERYWVMRRSRKQKAPFERRESAASGVSLILINELVFGSFFTLGQTSLIGIYATFVIAVGRFVR